MIANSETDLIRIMRKKQEDLDRNWREGFPSPGFDSFKRMAIRESHKNRKLGEFL